MNYATRLNSFLPKYDGELDQVFGQIKEIGIDYVDLNYPEHVADRAPKEMVELLNKHGLKANGVALRFRDEFKNGELGNADSEISNKALQLCLDAVDYCHAIGGETVTIWLGFDGFDYSFQIDYVKVWNKIRDSFIKIADHNPAIKISVEYKPFQPRAYAFVDSFGTTFSLIKEVNRPNFGATLDYCHMLMKHENPAFAASILGQQGKLFGLHLNDGYGLNDDGLMVGTSSIMKTLELLYYMKRDKFDAVIYFDTFPVIENPVEECQFNLEMTEKLFNVLDTLGMEKISQVIEANDGVLASRLLLDSLK